MDIKGIVKRLKKNHNTCAHELGHSILHPNVNESIHCFLLIKSKGKLMLLR